jgi:glycosyltransferase involved in cell wall biosynthesis
VKVSLVVASVDRILELDELFASLLQQSHKHFEVIVVDQNTDGRLKGIITDYLQRGLEIKHLYSCKGLSRARNVGLQAATGSIIAFPDDDCKYPVDLLRTVVRLFRQYPEYAGLTGRAIDAHGHYSTRQFDTIPGLVTKSNIWRQGISFTMFFRATVAARFRFDETLGVGAKWGSGEETDYLLSIIEDGHFVLYTPNLQVVHPAPVMTCDARAKRRAWNYGLGMGRVLRKHHYSRSQVFTMFARPLGGAVLSLFWGRPTRAAYYFHTFCGRLAGWLA